MNPLTRIYVCLLAFSSIGVFFQSPVDAQVNIDVIAITGDAAPTPEGGTNGVFGDFFGSFGNVSINDSGQVLFTAAGIDNSASGINDNSGLFLGDASGVVSIARRGQTVPGVGTFSQNFSAQVARNSFLDNSGQVTFNGFLDDVSGSQSRVFVSDGSSQGLNLITTPPGTPIGGTISTNGSVTVLASNDFLLVNTPDQPTDFAIAAATGTEIPGFFNGAAGTSIISDFRDFDLDFNDSGTFVFRAETESRLPNGLRQREDGVFRISDNEITTLARRATPAPDSANNGDFGSQFSDISVNDAGQAVFLGSVNADTLQFNDALFFSDGENPLSIFAIEGDAAPFAPDRQYNSFSNPILNDTGQLVFQAGVTGETNSTVLILADLATGELTPIFETGDAAPDGDGVFRGGAREVFINDNGQVAFTAPLTNSSNNISLDEGIFLFDTEQGITQVIRDERDLLGSQVASFSLEGFNNRGEIGIDLVLNDRRSGVIVASVASAIPEPSGLLLLGIGAVAIATRRRR